MRTIWKFTFDIVDEQVVMMPDFAEIVGVGLDPLGLPAIWAEVTDSDKSMYPRRVFIVGTGNPIPPPAARRRHRGLIVQGSFVWHVYA